CLIAIIMAIEIQCRNNKCAPNNGPATCVKHFVKNELSCINGCNDLDIYMLNNHNTTCYVSNSLGMESSCWTKFNNSF
ncbi:MAG: hypothetical protein LBI37_00835, partial [Puniceicoccales bacterium]|nr:hypothetical protein [Puniceicoccales bacterium]